MCKSALCPSISGVSQSSVWFHPWGGGRRCQFPTPWVCDIASYFTCHSVKGKAVTSNARGKLAVFNGVSERLHTSFQCRLSQSNVSTITFTACWLRTQPHQGLLPFPIGGSDPGKVGLTTSWAPWQKKTVRRGEGARTRKRDQPRTRSCQGSLACTGRVQGRPEHLESRERGEFCADGTEGRRGVGRALEAKEGFPEMT